MSADLCDLADRRALEALRLRYWLSPRGKRTQRLRELREAVRQVMTRDVAASKGGKR